jgi:hypothetical protein
MTIRRIILAASLVTLAVWAVTAVAAELIGLPGSSVRYSSTIESKVGTEPTTLTLTGVAMRKKLLFNVYAVGSYVQEGAKVKTAEDLAAADVPKMLHLILERDIDGKDLAQAFTEAIRLNYPAPTFDGDIAKLSDALKSKNLKKGDQLQIIHVPGVGVEFNLNGKVDVVITNMAFAKAVWEIYLGPRNLGAEIKAGLVFRL